MKARARLNDFARRKEKMNASSQKERYARIAVEQPNVYIGDELAKVDSTAIQ